MALDFLSKYKLKNLLYFMIIISGLLCNIAAFTIDFVLYGYFNFLILFLVMAFAFLVLGLFGLITARTETMMLMLLVLLDFIESPLVLYVYGINATPYLMLIIILNTEILKGRIRAALISIMFSLMITAVFIGYYFPQKFVDFGKSRYIPGMISFIIVASVMILISLSIIGKYNTQVERNNELEDKLAASSLRDETTRAFTKKYANECLDYMLANVDKFSIGVYKIVSYDKLLTKYGRQYVDVAASMLADILIDNASTIAIISRYSASTFLVIYNEYETDAVKDAQFRMNEEINNSLSKMIDISVFSDKGEKNENISSLINKIAIRINGFDN